MNNELNKKLIQLDYFIETNENKEAIDIINDLGVNYNDNRDGTPLLIACLYNNAEIAKYCIENGADVNVKDSNKSTPLHYACEKGNFDIIKLLVEKGANINLQNKYSKSPLAKAIAKNPKKLEVIEFLLRNDGDAFLQEEYMKDDPRRTNFNAYEYAKFDIKSEAIVALIEKYNKQ